MSPGDELTPGFGSNFHTGRVSNNIYFTALVDTAAWGTELATALAGYGAGPKCRDVGHALNRGDMSELTGLPNVGMVLSEAWQRITSRAAPTVR